MRASQPRALFVLNILLSLTLVSCFGGHGGGGGGGNGGGGNGGGGTPATVQILTKPASVPAGTQFAFQATTMHNHGNPLGVNWTIKPSSGQGTLTNPVNPTDGSPSTVTYTAPAMTTCNQCVTITATSIENPNSSDFVTFSITPGTGGGNVSILLGQYAFLFSGFDANGAVSVAGSINVDQNGNVTGEEDFKDPVTLLTAQSVSGNCQNLPVAATGFCNLTAGGRTSRYDLVLRNNGTVARLAEDPSDGANAGSGVLIAQQVPSANALISAGGFNGYFSVQFGGTGATGGRMGVEGNIFTDLSATITPGANGSQADINDNGALIQPSGSTSNVTGKMTGPVDANGRVTAQMTIGGSRILNLALYILAPEVPASAQSGRAFAIEITAGATNMQVLSGQFFWLGNPPPAFNGSSIGGTNVFALWGVAPGTPGPPLTAPSTNTLVGTLSAQTAGSGQMLIDANTGGSVNGGGGVATPLTGGYTLPNGIANNGRVVVSVTVGTANLTYVLYLDAANDGNLLETGGDNTVSFGFLTGQVPNSKFDNAHIVGTYVIGTSNPVLPNVPNGVSPLTLTPNGQSGSGATLTFSGNFTAGSTNGSYAFVQATGRGTALASSGQIFGNSNAVFYIVTPNLLLLMGADQSVTSDPIALIQF